MTLSAPTDTRSRLVQTAAERFLDEGYAETSVRSIADAMGIKAGSIYYHFPSKDDILAEVFDTGIALITESVQDAVAEHEKPKARLEAAIRAHLRALFDHGAFTACHVRVFHQAPLDVQGRSTVARDRYEQQWTQLIADAHCAGDLPPGADLHLMRLFILGALNATVEWFGVGERDIDDVAAEFTRLVLGAGKES